MKDPVEVLQSVIDMATAYKKLSHLLDCVRRIDESPEQTLDRLLRERTVIVKLLQSREASKHDHSEFDFEYKENFFVVIDRYVRTAFEGWWRK